MTNRKTLHVRLQGTVYVKETIYKSALLGRRDIIYINLSDAINKAIKVFMIDDIDAIVFPFP